MDHFLQSEQLEVGIKSLGAELFSIRNRQSAMEYIWQADAAEWGRHAPVLFPIVGRLKQDSYKTGDTTYHLGQHGFARDMEFTLGHSAPDWLNFILTANEATRSIFPFDFRLEADYRLTGNVLKVGYTVSNPASAQLLCSIGAHPAFRVPLVAGEARSAYELLFEHDEVVPVQLINGGLRTGQTAPLPMKNRRLPITDSLFDNDALVLKGLQSRKISIAKAGDLPFLHFTFDAPYFGIWSKSRTAQFVCLEPWKGVADSAGHDQVLANKEGILSIAPGQSERLNFSIEVAR